MSLTKLVPLGDLESIGKRLHSNGDTIVFTNGCFDLFHAGHVDCLAAAKQMGDWLFVGINTDRSVASIKGSCRPLISLSERAAVVMAMTCVDFVVVSDDDTPIKIIKALRPDVLAKGGDWVGLISGAAEVECWGGSVCLVPFKTQLSTTRIIERAAHRYGRE